MNRMSWDRHWMAMAWLVSERSTCERRSVGAVLVTPENRILTTGYNGSPAGLPHCFDVGCLLDAQGRCKRSVHAEMNAIITAARHGVSIVGSTLYSTDRPCEHCTAMVLNSGIARVVYDSDYMLRDDVRDGVLEMISLSGVPFVYGGVV